MGKAALVHKRSFSISERQEILKKTKGKCAHCGCKLKPDTMTVEHIFPISKGGGHDEFNLTALCESCNFKKSNNLYGMEEYYKFIDKEYIEEYKNQLIRYNVRANERGKIVTQSEKIFYTIPMQLQAMIARTAYHGASRKRLDRLVKNSKKKLIMERAFEGDSDEILAFIESMKDEVHEHIKLELYDNIYKVRNCVKYGQVYTIRYNDKITGVFMFKNLNKDSMNYVQLNNLSELTGYKKGYVCTLALVDKFSYDAFDEIMFYFFYRLISLNMLPIYFNILKADGNTDTIITIPHEIEHVQGTLDFFTYKGMKEYIKSKIKNTDSGLFEQNEVEDVIDNVLYGLDETDEDKELTLQLREELLRQNY